MPSRATLQHCCSWALWCFTVLLSLLAHVEAQQNGVASEYAAVGRPLTLVLPLYQASPHLYDIWTPLANHLGQKLRRPVRLRTFQPFQEMVPKILQAMPEFVFVNAWQYVQLHAQGKYEALIGWEHPHQGVFLVRVDSAVQTLPDLRGKTIALLPSSAMAAHLQPKVLLLEHRLVAEHDYTIHEMANMDLVMQAVIEGKVDAGVVALTSFRATASALKPQFRVIATTPPQPSSTLAVRQDIDPMLREELVHAMLDLNESEHGMALLQALGFGRTLRISDARYDVTRQFLHQLGLSY